MRRVAQWCAAVLLGLSGCTVPPLPDLPSPQCEHTSDCDAGQVCGVGGACLAECVQDRDCKSPLVCNGGACVPAQGQCVESRQCPAGQVCSNGLCAKSCVSSGDCGAGFSCLNNVCVSQSQGCSRDNECASDKVCSGLGTCATPCTTGTDCAAGDACSAGACVKGPTACAGAADCTAPLDCVSSVCAAACTGPADCAKDQVCTSGHCTLLPPGCQSASDCPTGKTCSNALCVDACVSSRDCRDGLTCSFGVCVAPGTGCLQDSNCMMGKACSPNGECVTACAQPSDCGSGTECSNGACVAVGPTTAKITGTVTLMGVADSSGIAVTLRGPSNDSAITPSSGQYAFAGLTPGRYTLTFTAASTAEKTLSVEVAAVAATPTTAPAAVFTAVGTLTGKVKFQNATQHAGIAVALTDVNLVANTDSSGSFTLRDVPIGSHPLLATAPLFIAATLPSTAVLYNQTVTQPDITLAPAPVTTGSVFSFVSTPPAIGHVAQPYVYTAIAGGGGIMAPTYALVAGPVGFSVDAVSGIVSWTPTASQINVSQSVILSATGGNATVYQIFLVQVLTPFSLVLAGTGLVDTFGSSTWISTGSSSAVVINDGGAGPGLSFPSSKDSFTGTATSVRVLNGGNLTAIKTPVGTFTGISGPMGTLAATWQGGTIGTVTYNDTAVLASKIGPTAAGTVKVQDGDVITDLTFTGGAVQSFSYGRSTPTSVTADTGTVTGVTPTVLTDTTANFIGATGKCVVDFDRNTTFTITGSTATTLSISSGDFTTLFSVGHRYYLVTCAGQQMGYTLTQSAAAFGVLTSDRVDLYANGLSLGNFAVTANTATTITFQAPVSLWNDWPAVATNGFYVVAPATGVPVTLTDSTVALGAGLSATNRVAFDQNVFNITANTATTVTFTVGFGTLRQFVPGVGWRLTDFSNRTAVTFTFAAGAFVPAAYVGKLLFVDPVSTTFPVTANTATTITALVDSFYFPVTGGGNGTWRSSYAGVTTTTSPFVTMTDPSANYAVNALVGYNMTRIVSNTMDARGTVSANTATTITYQVPCCSATRLRDAVTVFTGARYSLSEASGTVRFKVTVSGSPGWAPDSMLGRGVVLSDYPNQPTATIVANTANTLTVETTNNFAQFQAWDTAGVGAALTLSSELTPFKYRATINDAAAAYTPNALQGFNLVSQDGTVQGTISSNTATSVTALIGNGALPSSMGPGSPYAIANPSSTAACGSSGRITANVTLAGATLTANGYSTLDVGGNSYAVLANTSSSLDVAVCPGNFGVFLSARGQPGFASMGGRSTVTFTDSAATFTPGALVGQRLSLFDAFQYTPPVVSNTATQMQVAFLSSDFFNVGSLLKTGARYAPVDAAGDAQVSLTTDLTLAPSVMKGRVISLHGPTSVDVYRLYVDDNSASTFNVRVRDSNLNDFKPQTGAPVLDTVTTSIGVALRLTDGSAAFSGPLVGRTLTLSGRTLQVTASTGTTLDAFTTDDQVLVSMRTTKGYSVLGFSGGSAVAALGNEDGLFVVNDSQQTELWRYSAPTGLVTVYDSLTTATPLQLQVPTVLTGTVSTASLSSPIYTVRDQAAGFTPGALVGSVLRVKSAGSNGVSTFPIVANTANVITAFRVGFSGSVNPGDTYAIEAATWAVTGGALTPGALVGKRMRLNAVDYFIRANTASSVTVVPPLSSSSDSRPWSVGPGGATGYALAGVTGATIRNVVRHGSGFALASADGVADFDGTAWSRYAEPETATVFASGSVTAWTATSLVDSSATFVAGALAGKHLSLPAGIFTITNNTTNSITFSAGTAFALPAVGDAYKVLNTDGLSSATDVAAGATTLYVALSGSGLYRFATGTWAHDTVASTESTLGAGDGLLDNTPQKLTGVSDTEVYVMSTNGVAHRTGSTWTQITVANTESMPGKGDGLPNSSVQDLLVVGSDLWFATNAGAARKSGSMWTTFGFAQGVPSGAARDLTLAPGNRVWAALSGGLYQLSP